MEIKKKYCRRCEKDKSVDDFHKNPTKKDGLQTMCKECRKKYHKEHYLKNKKTYKLKAKIYKSNIQNFVNRYKQFKKCKICEEKRFWVLEFHHRDKIEKSDNIGKFINDSNLKLLKKEIRKCDVVCSNCHKDIHYKKHLQ